MKKSKVIVLFALMFVMIVLILSGCEPKITEGEITEKKYMEEELIITYMPMTISDGKSTTTTIIPMFFNYPESWKIIIKAYNESEKKYVYEDFYVKENVFDAVEVGDYFKFDPEMGTNERPNIKREATDEEIKKYEEK